MMRIQSLLPALALLAACGSAPIGTGPPVEIEGWWVGTSRGGMFTARWRPTPDPIPANEPFEIELWIYGDRAMQTPLAGAQVFVSGWMPDHGHGMVRLPRAIDNGDGSYRVRGLLLHMRGRWQLFVDVVAGGLSERAAFEVRLE